MHEEDLRPHSVVAGGAAQQAAMFTQEVVKKMIRAR